MEAFEEKIKQGGALALEEAGKFFMQKDPVNLALKKISNKLEKLQVPYAVIGGMALVAHGYYRTTVDIDILVTSESLEKIHQNLVGLGYLPVFKGSKNLRDTEHGVCIEFVTVGGFPGDGKPKPISFPDPEDCNIIIDEISYVSLNKLVELKLASGMTNLGRLKDLADVQELIRSLELKKNFAESLEPYVRDKFLELLNALENC